MTFKLGDKVSFLNEKREGIVKKIINDKLVSVEIEDGFEIPVVTDELIKTGESRFNEEDEFQDETEIGEQETEQDEEFEYKSNLFLTLTPEVDEGVYLAYIPQNEEDLLSGEMMICLLNHTSYNILFTYSLKEDSQFVGIDYDRAKQETNVLLEIVERTKLEKWAEIFLQILFFKEGKFEIKEPITGDFTIKPIKFYKVENYKYCSLINKKCILLPVSFKNIAEPSVWTEKMWRKEKIEKPKLKVVGHLESKVKIEPLSQKHIIDKGIAEVNLHIEKLIDNTSNLSNGEMLMIQINYFRKCMESALTGSFSKIIFIHGVGDGVLKSEIRKILKDTYSDCGFSDASMSKYGMGATEVYLQHNNV